MALPLNRKVILDTNVFVDYLRRGTHGEWVEGRVEGTTRFLSALVALELLLGADRTPRRRAVNRLIAAFPDSRRLAPQPGMHERAATLFRSLYSPGAEPADRLGPMNDILIALTAWHIGGTLVTSNLAEFHRIADELPGLAVVDPAAPVAVC